MKKFSLLAAAALMIALAAGSFAEAVSAIPNYTVENDTIEGGLTDAELDAHFEAGDNFLVDGQYGIVNAYRVKLRVDPEVNRSCKRNGVETRMGKNCAVVIVDEVTNGSGIRMYECYTSWGHGYIPCKYVTLKENWTEDDYRQWMHGHLDYTRNSGVVIAINGVKVADDDAYVIAYLDDGSAVVLDQDGNEVPNATVVSADK